MTSPVSTKRRRPVGIVVGALLLLGAVGLFVAGIFLAVSKVDDAVRSFQRVGPSGATIVVPEAGTYRVYAEFPGADDAIERPAPPRIESSDSRDLTVRTPGHSESYSFDGHEGTLVGMVEFPSGGVYDVNVGGEPGARGSVTYAFADASPFRSFITAGLTLAAAVVVGIVGVVVLVVSIVRRARRGRVPTTVAPPLWAQPGSIPPPPPPPASPTSTTVVAPPPLPPSDERPGGPRW